MNRTDNLAEFVHGTNPQFLIEKITRTKIYESYYWRESCFALNAETLINKAMDLKYIGGTYGDIGKPTHFICLVLKLLQLQPDLDIIYEYINQEDLKYLRLLGAFYLRMVGRPADIYIHLEPLYADYRNVRVRTLAGWSVCHIDEFIDELLHQKLVCDIALPHMPVRSTVVTQRKIGSYVSSIEAEVEDILEAQAIDSDEPKSKRKKSSHKGSLFDRAFGKKDTGEEEEYEKEDNSKQGARQGGQDRERDDRFAEEREQKKKEPQQWSIEYWNRIRVSLGMSLLRE